MTNPHAAATRLTAITTAREQRAATRLRPGGGWMRRVRELLAPAPWRLERDRLRADHAAFLCERVLLRDRAARYAGLPGREAAAQRRCLERGLAHLDQRLAVTAQQIDVLEAPPRTRALTH